jgi:polyphenol oxidase
MLSAAGFGHAFFTRTMSFGAALPDAETIAANFRVAAGALGVEPAQLYVVTQVHGRSVVSVRGDEDRHHVLVQRADAIVTRAAGVACGVRTADCVPVLVADRTSGAVAAIHSGWQGTEKDVVGAAVAALTTEAGGEPDLVAAIGPHIRTCCFEVGEDVAGRLAACSTARDVVDKTLGARPHVDLAKVVQAQLIRAGVPENAIDDVPGCTMHDADRFFSFRRKRDKSGRMLAAIAAHQRGS